MLGGVVAITDKDSTSFRQNNLLQCCIRIRVFGFRNRGLWCFLLGTGAVEAVSNLEVFVMSADLIQNIFMVGLATDSQRQVIKLAAKQAKGLSRLAARFRVEQTA